MSNVELTFAQLKPLILADIKSGNVPLLLGQPGIGKSSLVRAISDEFDSKTFTVHANFLATTEDLTGMRLVDNPNRASQIKYVPAFYPQASITRAIDYAQSNPDKKVILFLDEINRTTPEVTSALLSLITEREIGDITLPDNICLIAAGNDDGNVVALDTASVTRFALYHTAPSASLWLDVMNGKLNPYVEKAIKKNPDLIMAEEEKVEDDDDIDSFDYNLNKMSQYTNPRTLDYVSKWLTNLGFTGKRDRSEIEVYHNLNDTAPASLLAEGLFAHLGKTKTAATIYKEIVTSLDHLTLAQHSRSYLNDNFINAVSECGENAINKIYPDSEDRINVLIGLLSKTENANLPKSVKDILIDSAKNGALKPNSFDQSALSSKINALKSSEDLDDSIMSLLTFTATDFTKLIDTLNSDMEIDDDSISIERFNQDFNDALPDYQSKTNLLMAILTEDPSVNSADDVTVLQIIYLLSNDSVYNALLNYTDLHQQIQDTKLSGRLSDERVDMLKRVLPNSYMAEYEN